MAAKDLESGAIKQQELDDITTCCICTEFFTNPKALPCIHTFCMKCIQETGLKTNKGPGDEMPCPICRRQFKIPPEGFRGLPKNFFIERLLQASNISDNSASSRAACDVCLEDNKEEAGKEIPAADAYCVECKHKLCEECSNEHKKFKMTKNHKLIPMTEDVGVLNVLPDLAPSVCELHEQKVLDVYCADCKTVVCAMCFIDDHNNHKGSHVKKFVDGFRNRIESYAKAINECRSQGETKKAELLKVKEVIQKRVETLECDIVNRKDELKQFADKHADSLLQGLCFIRQSKLKEIQLETGDIDSYLSCLETCISYCEKIIAKGSASDICGAFADLSVRAVELQEQCKPMIERKIQSFNFHFRKSELEELLKEICDNLIGEIEEAGDWKPKKRSKESLLAEQSSEIDLLRKEIEIERTKKENLRLANEQLRSNIDNGVEANKVLKEELDKEKIANNSVRTDRDKLKQDLDKEKLTNNSLKTNIDQLKQELDKEKIANNSVQSDKDKLKQDLDKEKLTNNSLQTSNNKLTEEVNTYKTTIKTLEGSLEKLKQELDTKKTDILQNTSDAVLVHTIKTKAAKEGKKAITGFTILYKEMFVLSTECSDVEVYETIKFTFTRRWNLKELNNPEDIGSCDRNKCLYIFDSKDASQSSEILRVDPNGKIIKKWSTGNDCGRLSVTNESNVILTVFKKNKLNEYSSDGQLVREIILSSASGIRYSSHAIKLSNGHFVVSHSSGDDDGLHRVCVVDADGKLMKSFGGKRGSDIGQMNYPSHLSVDVNGFVMVADHGNGRVLLLDPDLKFKREILSKGVKHGLQRPTNILLDEPNGRVFVVDDNIWEFHGRILIFDLK